MSKRQEFVAQARAEGSNIAALCRQYQIARKTGYKWIKRYATADPSSLSDRSRRPHGCVRRTQESIEQLILSLREEHPCWGPRKLRRRLCDLGHSPESLPAPSTIAAILRRNGAISAEESSKHRSWQRFEHEHPNQLWQIDFKGDFLLNSAERCYPLTLLDDHSRFNLLLRACANMQSQTVQTALIDVFQEYGLPERMLMDNGAPWGSDQQHRHTALTVWLMHLGIAISHGRPYHPQTQGKEERFHRTFKQELLSRQVFSDHAAADRAFADWRHLYNNQRPHDALDLAVPASRYRPSHRAFPQILPAISYGRQMQVRRVQDKGKIYFHGHRLHVGRGFIGYPVGLSESTTDGLWHVYFCQFKVAEIDLRLVNR